MLVRTAASDAEVHESVTCVASSFLQHGAAQAAAVWYQFVKYMSCATLSWGLLPSVRTMFMLACGLSSPQLPAVPMSFSFAQWFVYPSNPACFLLLLVQRRRDNMDPI